MSDEQQIRGLIARWAAAVHDGDLTTIVADHAPDIVMFDVPPPEHGVRGLDAYRDTWPGFFEWQASGAVFEIESLDVTAAADVAFAFALLRCGTPATPSGGCGSPSGCARSTAGGSLPTSTIRSPTRQGHRTSPPTRYGRCTRSGSTAPRLRISTG